MEIVYAPQYVQHPSDLFTIFLAGSIEMGEVEEWQTTMASASTHLKKH